MCVIEIPVGVCNRDSYWCVLERFLLVCVREIPVGVC